MIAAIPGRMARGKRAGRVLMLFAVGALLGGCAQPNTMYTWKSYQPAVYAYLQDEGMDAAAQVEMLRKDIETARARNGVLPPGFRAHLGMLHLKMGQGTDAVAQFQDEKLAFPESSPFMDFLLSNADGQQAGAAPATSESAQPFPRAH
ncbi:DUF4810 domain-containing protein [Achromobacter xylosoxidans]